MTAPQGGQFAMQDGATRREIMVSTGTSLLVEAAAGTGKTTLIVDRILQGVRDGTLRLSSTVAITFTEKAAGELESRLRSKLAETVHRADICDAERARLLTAVEELDRAQISTIHAFCRRLLSEKPIEAGVDPESSVLDEAPAELLRQRCWQEWMMQEVARTPAPLVEALRAGVRTDDLRRIAWALAAAPEVLEGERFELGRAGEGREAAIRSLRAAAAEAAPIFERDMTGRGNSHSRALRKVAAAGAGDAIALRRVAYRAAGVDLEQALKSIRAKARGEARPVLERLLHPARRLGARLAHDVFAWLAGFIGHYAEAKRARSVLDFQDLLVFAARVLRENVGVRRYFQRRFDAFFVDEFQDTDPLQAELIAYLCERPSGVPAGRMEDVRLEDGKLVAVGDPKQSIYRFRRADVRIYRMFRHLLGAERVKLLSCNFRSSQPLLDWFNRLFEHIFGLPTAAGVRQAAHVPLAPGLEGAAAPGPSVIAFCPPPALDTREWDVATARRHEAHFLARAVRDMVEDGRDAHGSGGGLRYGDFAFLLRALTDVGVYEDALDQYGVPYRVVGSKHFYRREQVAETLTLLRAVDDPLDEAAVVGALRSSFFAVSDEELFRYRERGGLWNYLMTDVRSGPAGEATALLADWHRKRNRIPPQVLLAQVFDVTKAVQAFRLKPAGAQRAANLEKMLSDLRGLGPAVGSFGALVGHLNSLREAELPEAESSIVEPGDDFVQILTMHKAKGLEFAAVVLPDLFRRFPGRAKVAPLLFNRLDGRLGLKVAAGIESERYGELAAEEHGNELAELSRLLYVACTRARRLLVLSLHWKRGGPADCFQALLTGSDLFASPDDVPYGEEREGVHYFDTRPLADGVDLSPRLSPLPEGAEEDARVLLRDREKWRVSHEGLAAGASAAEPCVLPSALGGTPESARPHVAEGAGEEGRGFGSLFHNVMGAVPLERRGRAETPTLVRNLAVMEADGLGLGGEEARQAAELVLAALRNPEFLSLLEGADVARKDVPFAVPLRCLPICPDAAEGFAEGSIDLLLRGPRGAVVLDYKTDRVAGADLERASGRYWPQLALYGLAAQTCGWADAPPDLALFFVRTGTICRRALDGELLARAAEAVVLSLAAQAG